MYQIKSVGGKILYVAKSASDVRSALTEAASTGAYLDEAYLAGANLTGAYLDGANLDGAYLTRANLTGANLTGAYLAGAYLARANLTGAYLDGANLAGANLTGAYLDGATWQAVAETLRAAISAMNDSGRHWVQGTISRALEDGSTAYCSIGSVEAQKTSGTARAISLWLLSSVCADNIANFNDNPATTWEDVQAVFAVAIKHAERFASR